MPETLHNQPNYDESYPYPDPNPSGFLPESIATDNSELLQHPEFSTEPVPRLADLTRGIFSKSISIENATTLPPRELQQMDSLTGEILAKGDYSATELQEFIDSTFFWQSTIANRYHEKGHSRPADYGPVLQALCVVPVDKLFVALHADERGSNVLHTMLERSIDTGKVRGPLHLYSKVYGRIEPDLIDPAFPSQSDPNVRKLFAKEETVAELDRILREDIVPKGLKISDKNNLPALDSVLRHWEDSFLRNVAGLPADLANEIQRAAKARTTEKRFGIANCFAISSLLNRNLDIARTLGVDKMSELRRQTGTVNFDFRSVSQLERMNRLINRDPETIKHLQSGDVTVVLTDEFGDYNGMTGGAVKNYETESGRTLVFGITSRDDFRRHRELLEELGIKPSTLVIAAHGVPNSISFGQGDAAFQLTNELPPEGVAPEDVPKDLLHLELADELIKLINEGMQDSRGIDDDHDAIGCRRVILNSCLQAAPSEAWRYTSRYVRGRIVPQVIPFKTDDNMAEDLIELTGNKPNLVVYAGDAVQGVARTRYGVKFLKYLSHADLKQRKDIPTTHTPMNVTRYQYDPRVGRVTPAEVPEIRLRAVPDMKQ